ncbi:succinylglutamate desuccinylase/aspartoacylase family protein [Azospirillum sp.]|uniref:succinylglutamate desuccinylase/aspartoacylase domain-containing protein n=1 Tax=Azospirillum sp. TaxID=34012 RepID=UPI00262FCF24|nr:succinylglutamate desuccinylase/aspartoacylase family protein [Azospirillum sp.]
MTDPLFAPIELTPPDIAPHQRGNTGIEHVTSLTSDEPGPHVVLNALVHGNEISGAIALDSLLRQRLKPRRGRLTFVFANTDAYRLFDRQNPYASRFIDEDFNRIWSPEHLDGRRDSAELRRARQLRPVYQSADLLLDLHSMTADTAPLTLCGRTTRGRDLALGLVHPSWVVADDGHAGGRRLIDFGAFAEPEGARTAILVECGQHWRADTAVVALESCLRLLRGLEMIDESVGPRLLPRADPQRLVDVTEVVTAGSDLFRFTAPFVGLEVIGRAGTTIGWDGDRSIHTPYDDCVLIMPARRVKAGQTAVRLGRIVTLQG